MLAKAYESENTMKAMKMEQRREAACGRPKSVQSEEKENEAEEAMSI
jgi:hypothetical protein